MPLYALYDCELARPHGVQRRLVGLGRDPGAAVGQDLNFRLREGRAQHHRVADNADVGAVAVDDDLFNVVHGLVVGHQFVEDLARQHVAAEGRLVDDVADLGVGTVQRIEKDDNAIWYTIAAGPEVLKYVVEKGSITIDGISLTVARVDSQSFAISAIPHTVSVTVLADRKPGDIVNLETDIIGKYVEKLLHFSQEEAAPAPKQSSGITKEFLTRYGY